MILKYIISLTSCVSCVIQPPFTGKFFYSDFFVGPDIEVHYI